MNPEQPINLQSKEARNLRLIIVVGLILVLLAILATYIYYGMQLAKQPAEVTPEEPVFSETDRIIKALETAPLATPEQFEAVAEALESAPVQQPTNMDAMLEALGEPTSAPGTE